LETKPDYEMVKTIHAVIKSSKVTLPNPNDYSRLAFELYNLLIGFPDKLEKNISRAMEGVLKRGGPGLSKRDWNTLKNHLVGSFTTRIGQHK